MQVSDATIFLRRSIVSKIIETDDKYQKYYFFQISLPTTQRDWMTNYLAGRGTYFPTYNFKIFGMQIVLDFFHELSPLKQLQNNYIEVGVPSSIFSGVVPS